MRPTGSRSHGCATSERKYQFPNASGGFGDNSEGHLCPMAGSGGLKPEVTIAQWLTALLVVVMMLQHHPRVVPFPEGAPAHRADLACRPDQLQCPPRGGLVGSISRN